MKYVNVIVENKSRHTDNLFTYRTDCNDIFVGAKVIVPFGTKNRPKEGYVFEIAENPQCPEEKLKDVIEVRDNESLTEEIIKTSAWMKQRYAVKYYDGIRCFIPGGKPAREGREKEPYRDVKGKYRRPLLLTSEQQKAVDEIGSAVDQRKQDFFLIHGVTASGKTEVYMEIIDRCLLQGRTAIMLVPEISLTGQMIERFAGRFGKNKIAVMHSKLTPRERYDEWQRIRSGSAPIVIGARMGVFAPLINIGVIIMDEEHEATYKSDMTPKYDTVEVAAKRLQYHRGVLLLGSATPSVTSYQRCRDGIYKLIELRERYNKTPLPHVEIVDMRRELREGNTTIFSKTLYKAMSENLAAGKQVILLQNRRGYSNFILCRECGKVMKCPQCGISLTYHRRTGGAEAMMCHYCGRSFPVPDNCPECGSSNMKYSGIGTEQVEDEVSRFFPGVSTARLDLDAVKNRKELDGILDDFSKRKTDILIGTQMVAKGLDFENVGVVGVISADTTLNIPDYRSQERTFQLITQVAGRAGRGDAQGLVIVQTYEPGNHAITAAAAHDYQGFFRYEAAIRSLMGYPPFGDIITANLSANNETLTAECAKRCRTYMENALKTAAAQGDENAAQVKIFSPKVGVKFKDSNIFRNYLLIKCPKGERNRCVYYLDNFNRILIKDKMDCSLIIDVNPYSFF